MKTRFWRSSWISAAIVRPVMLQCARWPVFRAFSTSTVRRGGQAVAVDPRGELGTDHPAKVRKGAA
ncbi:hypothetical protein RGUI_2651 [Rhodovulum sp. P5]|nr:hypothetical protein RGUI_2651 [Rhodovulum sp. P5]